MNAAPRTIAGSRTWLMAGVVGVGGVVAFALLFGYQPAGQPFYPLCYFHLLTGLNCPGCGSLRALHQLTHANFLAALRCNAVLVLSLPVLAFIGARRFRRWRAGGPPPRLATRRNWVVMLVAVLVIFGVLRNLPFAPFTHLSPP